MSRAAGGTYTLPTGNPPVAGTTITVSWASATLSDIATEMTDSLNRSGKGAMLAPLQATDGSVSLPSLTFGTDTDTGLYRVSANTVGMALGGSLKVTFAPTLLTVDPTVALVVAKCATGAEPAGLPEGGLCYDTTTQKLKVCVGASWQAVH